MRLLCAEFMKYRRSLLNKLIYWVPLMMVACAFFMAGVHNFQSVSSYWWYSFILQGIIGVLCFLADQAEEVSGNSLMQFSLAVDLKRVRKIKHLVMVEKLLLSQLFFMLLVHLFPLLLFPGYSVYGLGQLLLAGVIIAVASAWQIPLCFILMRLAGKFIAVFTNIILGLVTLIVSNGSCYWILNPYGWCAKEMECILNIQINGVFLGVNIPYTSMNFLALFLAVIFFGVLSEVDAYYFEREMNR